MELSRHVAAIQADLAGAAGLGDAATAEAGRRLSVAPSRPRCSCGCSTCSPRRRSTSTCNCPPGGSRSAWPAAIPQLVFVEDAVAPEDPTATGDDLSARITLRLPEAPQDGRGGRRRPRRNLDQRLDRPRAQARGRPEADTLPPDLQAHPGIRPLLRVGRRKETHDEHLSRTLRLRRDRAAGRRRSAAFRRAVASASTAARCVVRRAVAARGSSRAAASRHPATLRFASPSAPARWRSSRVRRA